MRRQTYLKFTFVRIFFLSIFDNTTHIHTHEINIIISKDTFYINWRSFNLTKVFFCCLSTFDRNQHAPKFYFHFFLCVCVYLTFVFIFVVLTFFCLLYHFIYYLSAFTSFDTHGPPSVSYGAPEHTNYNIHTYASAEPTYVPHQSYGPPAQSHASSEF